MKIWSVTISSYVCFEEFNFIRGSIFYSDHHLLKLLIKEIRQDSRIFDQKLKRSKNIIFYQIIVILFAISLSLSSPIPLKKIKIKNLPMSSPIPFKKNKSKFII